MSKLQVYFMPGMAASSKIFERIQLSEEFFDMNFLEWEMPLSNETLKDYAQRMSKKVLGENIILIGVSFGGILVQEMAQFLNPKKVIIISSVKSNQELPKRMKIAKATKLYKILPTGLAKNLETLAKYVFGKGIVKQRVELYKKFMIHTEKEYLDWAIEQVVCWERNEPDLKVIHIQGDADEVFPVKNIEKYINVKGGTHIMILSKYKWLNENLPKLILE
ncbi:alpha/beta hydrolase [Flavobacterium oreochromis]|uniref:Alpha/beta hydrolase n=1 Tax=Flavobacterium columnare TaxID=996 RepID=A0A246GBE3_9FLAO|nr:alpha/beta hydrolase [Flavobacterium oreochromis]OWP77844.1 alpha/beta hydrolase [Flavobacterium oreochromis]POR28839.1 alpha/beta hydrolase [Flavobacterium columnare]